MSVTLDGPDAADFVVTAPPAATVDPGGNTPFTVTFTPSTTGIRTATLRIARNDADDNPFTLSIAGDGRTPTEIAPQAYIKASNTDMYDYFGLSVSVDGDTMVVGAPNESSNATGVNGNQNNNSAQYAGAAYVFVREGNNWTQQAYLKASNTGGDFGTTVSVSGGTVVGGGPFESTNARGVNGNQANNSAESSGAVYVLTGLGPLVPDPPVTSAPRILSIARDPGAAVALTVEVAPGRSYTLQVSEDLATWSDLGTQHAGGAEVEFTDTSAAGVMQRFYRVKED